MATSPYGGGRGIVQTSQFTVCLIGLILLINANNAIEVTDNLLLEYIKSHQHAPQTLPAMVGQNESDEDTSSNIDIPLQVEDKENSNETTNVILDNNDLMLGPTNYHEQHDKSMQNKHHLADERNMYQSQRNCEVEITQRIKGVCKTIGPIGTACVSGDYMDVFNAECM